VQGAAPAARRVAAALGQLLDFGLAGLLAGDQQVG
jgi:hypothetical protein